MSKKQNKGVSTSGAFGLAALAGIVGVGIGALLNEFLFKKNDKYLQQNSKAEQVQTKKQTPESQFTQIDAFHCPVSLQIMKNPTILITCSHTFDKKSIEEWLKDSKQCPICKAPARIEDLKPNYNLKNAIQELKLK